MMISLLIVVFGILFALLNSQFDFLPASVNWPVSIFCIFVSLIAYRQYRCPFCGKNPENEDVALFDPNQCSSCGEKLK